MDLGVWNAHHYMSYCSSDNGLLPDVENTECLSVEQTEALFSFLVRLEYPLEILTSKIAVAGGQKLVSYVIFGWSVEAARTVGDQVPNLHHW